MENTAYLSNQGSYITFSFRGKNIRFKGPYSLVRFSKVLEWDKGYLVVDAVYTHQDQPVEDYIDLVPVLNDLYMNPDEFLKPIDKVEVRYA